MALGMANLPTITRHNASARDTGGGGTALQQVGQFVTIKTAGVRDLVEELNALAGRVEAEAMLAKLVRRASTFIAKEYQTIAERHEATGNLAKSVTTIKRSYPNGRGGKAVVDVVGPRQTGTRGSKAGVESGNHAWLVEFGTGPRKPGTQNRRTYINVHQMVNRRMKLHPGKSMNDEQFANAGRGYYFLMGSLRERAGAGGKPGYSRDFADKRYGGLLGGRGGNEQHPITLRPGETLAPMPGLHIMQDVIELNQREVFDTLRNGLLAAIEAKQN